MLERQGPFTDAQQMPKMRWPVGLLRARLILSLALFVLSLAHTFENRAKITSLAAVYFGTTVVLSVLPRGFFRQKRIRALTIVLDLVAISVLVVFSGGLESSWYLLYFFPIMSAARYLGPWWSAGVATAALVVYGLISGTFIDVAFLTRSGMFLGIAATAANLAKQRDRAEAQLTSHVEKVQREILTDAPMPKILRSILDTAMQVTRSDASAVLVVDGTAIVASEKTGAGASEAERLVRMHYLRVVTSAAPLELPEGKGIATLLPLPSIEPHLWPGLLVPLQVDNSVVGVLGVFSRWRLHFGSDDRKRLSRVAPLIATAKKLARLRTESNERLDLLYSIDLELKAEQRLEQLFKKVVTLTASGVGSEEAALFILNDQKTEIVKVAAAAPTDDSRAALEKIEQGYAIVAGISLSARVAETQTGIRDNDVDQSEAHVAALASQLPSKQLRHYMGAPLRIGEGALGVIRVLNRKAADYSPATPHLATGGFTSEDLALLKVIATQIESAIGNAKFMESEQHFENLVESSPDPIIVLDRRGKIKNFNHACVITWKKEAKDAIGDDVADYYESIEHAREIMHAMENAPGNTIRDFEARIRDVRGTIIPILLSASLLKDRDNNVIGSIGVFKDRRLMLRMESERILTEKLAASRTLAQNRVHDLKHDLGTIMNWVDVIDTPDVSEDVVEALDGIRAAVQNVLTKLNSELLAADPRPERREVISLTELLGEFDEDVRANTFLWGVRFLMNLPGSDLPVLANSEQLRQVFGNLMGNSLDAIKERSAANAERLSGTITLDVQARDDTVHLVWCDDGIGMSEEAAASAFTPFFSTKAHGSGLGLFITQKLLQFHGGRITIEPAKTSGVCFRIELPVASGETA